MTRLITESQSYYQTKSLYGIKQYPPSCTSNSLKVLRNWLSKPNLSLLLNQDFFHGNWCSAAK